MCIRDRIKVLRAAKVVKRGNKFRMKFKVRSEVGKVDEGRVVIRLDGKKYATLKVRKNGKVVVKFGKRASRRLDLGRHKLVVKYLGTDEFESSRKKVRFRVRR